MPRVPTYLTISQLAAIARLDVSNVRKLLMIAPFGTQLHGYPEDVVEIGVFMKWLKGLSCRKRRRLGEAAPGAVKGPGDRPPR